MNWKKYEKHLEKFDKWCGRIADRSSIMDLTLFVIGVYALIHFIRQAFK
jgi:hypothetical protein